MKGYICRKNTFEIIENCFLSLLLAFLWVTRQFNLFNSLCIILRRKISLVGINSLKYSSGSEYSFKRSQIKKVGSPHHVTVIDWVAIWPRLFVTRHSTLSDCWNSCHKKAKLPNLKKLNKTALSWLSGSSRSWSSPQQTKQDFQPRAICQKRNLPNLFLTLGRHLNINLTGFKKSTATFPAEVITWVCRIYCVQQLLHNAHL